MRAVRGYVDITCYHFLLHVFQGIQNFLHEEHIPDDYDIFHVIHQSGKKGSFREVPTLGRTHDERVTSASKKMTGSMPI